MTRLKAVLLDRDGTLNVKAPEGEYVTGPDQLQLLPGAGRTAVASTRTRASASSSSPTSAGWRWAA